MRWKSPTRWAPWWDCPREMTGDQVYGLLGSVGAPTALLAEAYTTVRQRVYRSAGVHLRYQRTERGEKVTACLRVGLFRVGGPIRTRRPRSYCGRSWRWRGERPGEGCYARRPSQRTVTPSSSATRNSGSPVRTGQSRMDAAPAAKASA